MHIAFAIQSNYAAYNIRVHPMLRFTFHRFVFYPVLIIMLQLLSWFCVVLQDFPSNEKTDSCFWGGGEMLCK